MKTEERMRFYIDHCDDGLGCPRGFLNAVLIYAMVAIFVALAWSFVKAAVWVWTCL